MTIKLTLFYLLLTGSSFLYAQTPIEINSALHLKTPSEIQIKLINALDTMLVNVNKDRADSAAIQLKGIALSVSVFNSLKGIEAGENEPHFYKPQLINLYPVDSDQYFISIAYVNKTATGIPLRAIVNFMANADNAKVTFAIPLYYISRKWKTTRVGNITYHYPDDINLARAKAFDKKSKHMAVKFGLQPEHFDFYLCDNYPEKLGYAYDSSLAGAMSDGYGIDEGVIFSINHNEDFSHDLFHYYAAKVRINPRNGAAEEGVAYSWGNAYYTDEHGEMISQGQLVVVLKLYLQQHPKTSLLELFSKNPPIFKFNTKVRSLISSLICDEVEKKKGIDGIEALINCGKGDDNYFKVVNELTGINVANFDLRVGTLLKNYK